jgi:glutathione S-transferase
MLKIWGRTSSVNVQKVTWAVGELDLPHERIDAGLAYGQVNEPWYRAMNPNGRVPVIDDDGFILWESNAIVRYLARRYGMGTLCPEDARSAAAADRWMDWATTTVHPVMTPLFWGLIRTAPEKRDLAAIESDRQKMEEIMAVLDTHLSKQPYVAGDAFTMGDIPVGAFTWRWRNLPIPRGAHPHLTAWAERLEARPAYRANVMLPLS